MDVTQSLLDAKKRVIRLSDLGVRITQRRLRD